MKKIRLFEMFAGYGGASFALKKAGIDFECVGYSEIDKSAIEVYNLNHPNIKNYGNCREIKPEELPDFDLLTGGFPCQPFSVNTNHNARGEHHKDANLFQDILRILRVKKPKYVLLENVKGILGKKSKKVYEELCNGLRDIGYDLIVEKFNSKDYGTPQNRQRVYFICKLGSWDGEFVKPLEEELHLTVNDLLERDVKRREPRIRKMKLNKEENKVKFGDISRLDAILQCPVEKRNSNMAYEILDAPSKVVSRQIDRIYHPTHAPCLTATGTDYIFMVDGELKVLTPKECFRLMGFFNDEIKLPKIAETKLHKLAGNGWDINLVSKILKGMNMVIDNSEIEINKEKKLSFEEIYIERLEKEVGEDTLKEIKSQLFDKIRNQGGV